MHDQVREHQENDKDVSIARPRLEVANIKPENYDLGSRCRVCEMKIPLEVHYHGMTRLFRALAKSEASIYRIARIVRIARIAGLQEHG